MASEKLPLREVQKMDFSFSWLPLPPA